MDADRVDSNSATLLLAITPLHGSGAASARLARGLRDAGLIVAAEVARLRAFAARLGVEPSGAVTAGLPGDAAVDASVLTALGEGRDVLVCTEGALPDASAQLVNRAAEQGARVTCLPGPSAVTAALALSGLPSDRFAHDGDVPGDEQQRRAWLEELGAETRTCTCTVEPRLWPSTRADMLGLLGPGRDAALLPLLDPAQVDAAAVCRGTLADLPEQLESPAVLVLGPAEQHAAEPADLVASVNARVAAGERLKDAAAAVAAETGVRKKELYDAVLAARERAD